MQGVNEPYISNKTFKYAAYFLVMLAIIVILLGYVLFWSKENYGTGMILFLIGGVFFLLSIAVFLYVWYHTSNTDPTTVDDQVQSRGGRVFSRLKHAFGNRPRHTSSGFKTEPDYSSMALLEHSDHV